MYHIKLFTNKTPWVSVNEIEQLNCKGYKAKSYYKIPNKEVLFDIDEKTTIYGCYITNDCGQLYLTQRFEKPLEIPKEGATIAIMCNK